MTSIKLQPQAMLQFLENLAANNTKTWMDEHRTEYQELRAGLVQIATEIHAEMLGLDPTLLHMDPRKSLFRINRDIRFSNNKQPYKTHMGSKMSPNGQKKGIAGYGFGTSANGHIYIMGGINKLPTPQLNQIRDGIIHERSPLLKVFKSKNMTDNFEISDLGFGKLKTVPRGYAKDHPEAGLLKLQAYWAMQRVGVKAQSHDQIKKLVLEQFEHLIPMVREINQLISTEAIARS